jgi:endoribonuclease Dicer
MYTCASESVLAQFIPFSTPKFKFYRHEEIPCTLYGRLVHDLQSLEEKVSTFYVCVHIYIFCNIKL